MKLSSAMYEGSVGLAHQTGGWFARNERGDLIGCSALGALCLGAYGDNVTRQLARTPGELLPMLYRMFPALRGKELGLAFMEAFDPGITHRQPPFPDLAGAIAAQNEAGFSIEELIGQLQALGL